ncbi:F-box domain-containing protein [Dioscorea alata]|uniref:F-box domain-containing protein n=1 Tax=Dioscorea alata TaxID=55571 RepID=A0ACB7TXB6_DIOAL|nr:F-box domain-containing protein [Dioscorea alata]
MGSLLSAPVSRTKSLDDCQTSQTESCKRLKMTVSCDDNSRLISSLPDEISLQILARVPRICYLSMKLVAKNWKAALSSNEVYQLRKELGLTEEWLYILVKVERENTLMWLGLDPVSRKWQRLPPIPNVPPEEESSSTALIGSWMWNVLGSSVKIADYIRGWMGRRNVFERIRLCGCATGVVDGCLYVVGGFSTASAMKSVWRYDPCLNQWREVRSMTTGRAFCKTGLLNNKLYVVGGVNLNGGSLTPLLSAEVFDPCTEQWSEVPTMPFAKADLLAIDLLADMLKPMATGMTPYMGKLYVPQSLYCWPFFVDVGGQIYDPETNSWFEMPPGMGDGWPARQAGTKLSVIVGGDLFALEPSNSTDGAKIKRYDFLKDEWNIVVETVPVHDFTNSHSRYLLASLLGKVHVITKDADNNTTILQADLQDQTCPSTSRSSSTLASSSHGNASSSSASSSRGSFDLSEGEMNAWKVIARKNFGTAELVSCQSLNV